MNKVGKSKNLIDTTGLVCPYPEMLTLEALKKVPTGGTLEVSTDNPPSVEAIPQKVESRGHVIEKVEKVGERLWKIIIRKK